MNGISLPTWLGVIFTSFCENSVDSSVLSSKEKKKKKKDSLPLSVMETYTAYSKSAHNVKTNILVQKMIFSVMVRGLTGSKWK